MKLNSKTALLSPKILLVPYELHHVPTYHAWMEDEDLRTATASDRLTLSEEHAMQKSWREDGDKLTFIACLPPTTTTTTTSSAANTVRARKDDVPECMLGDVNLFLYPSPEHDEAGGKVVAEVEVMIARREFHGTGLGREVVGLFLWYVGMHKEEVVGQGGGGRELVGFRVKIAEGNSRSIRLFEGLGFERVGGVSYFEEVELVRGVDGGGMEGEGVEREWRVLGYEYEGEGEVP
ncbi:hypothetical protein C7212DRAFT_280500 [Tuber magnatum]|uniref:N-acetyltransferase domain-containing protein n=1 Tax=Tuber magnatum TaxID=42249 RepID=A0A317SP62_9PEZI|nr:hypothetical protein C7212DRAFT_280500 [Tuber magnatum]